MQLLFPKPFSREVMRPRMIAHPRAVMLAMALLMISAVSLRAQSRAIGADALALDDGSGHIVTILAPPGMSGNYTYTLPPSPGSSITSGYVAMGSAAGQTLFWNGSY